MITAAGSQMSIGVGGVGGTYAAFRRPVVKSEGAPRESDEKLRRTVQEFLGQAFYGPMMRQMRESPFKSDKFEGGRGGAAFSSLLDQTLIQRAAQGSGGIGGNLADAMVRKFSVMAAAAELRSQRVAEQMEAQRALEASRQSDGDRVEIGGGLSGKSLTGE